MARPSRAAASGIGIQESLPSSLPLDPADADRVRSAIARPLSDIARGSDVVANLFTRKMDELIINLSASPQRGRGLTTDADILKALTNLLPGRDSADQIRSIEFMLDEERKLHDLTHRESGSSLEDLKFLFRELLEKLKEIGDETGITQVIEGLLGVAQGLAGAGIEGFKFLAERLPDLLSGSLSLTEFLAEGADRLGPQVMKVLEGHLDTLIGTLRVIGEVTGISDIIRGIMKIAKGEVISGTILLGFGIAQVAAFVATAGGSGVAIPVIKQFGKSILRWALGQGAEEAQKYMLKHFAKKFLLALREQAGGDLAGFVASMVGEEAAKEFMELIRDKGLKALTEEDVVKFICKYCKEKIIAWLKAQPEEYWTSPPQELPIVLEDPPPAPFPSHEPNGWDSPIIIGIGGRPRWEIKTEPACPPGRFPRFPRGIADRHPWTVPSRKKAATFRHTPAEVEAA